MDSLLFLPSSGVASVIAPLASPPFDMAAFKSPNPPNKFSFDCGTAAFCCAVLFASCCGCGCCCGVTVDTDDVTVLAVEDARSQLENNRFLSRLVDIDVELPL